MLGKGRGRDFISGGSRDSPKGKSAPPSLSMDAPGLVSGVGLAGRFSAPPEADSCKKRKSNVMS